ncbi:hypothetical protein SO694_00012039 [Aureococcus anophagefferens]|uniref:Uncharacterized protein n=1 Tax=Aureococcus anophagefferens TaxID=44056 RepID=A0ABR1G1K6_AURAN
MAALEQSSSSTETDEQSSSNAAPIPWFCCSDGNHWPLAERLVAQLGGEASPFAPSCRRVEDLGGLPGRAAGGLPVQDFKLRELERLCGAARCPFFAWSDASACSRSGRSTRARGAAAAAAVAAARGVCASGREEMAATKRLDQKVLNQIVLRGGAPVRIARLDAAVWASSNAAPPPLGSCSCITRTSRSTSSGGRARIRRRSSPSSSLCVVYGCVLMLEIRTRSPSGTRGSRGFGLMRASTATARHFPAAERDAGEAKLETLRYR